MKTKKLMSILLSIALVLSVVNIAPVYAEGNTWDVSMAQDGSVTATYDEATKTLTISGSGDMAKYSTTSLPPYNDYLNSIENVVIEDGVTNIGNRAFKGSSSLTSVKIGNNVTSIGEYAFSDCKGLVSVEIPDSVTTINGRAFKNCSSLTSIEIPDSVTELKAKEIFYNCTALNTFTWNAYPVSIDTSVSIFKGMGSSALGEKTAYIDTRNTDLKTALESVGYTIVDSSKNPEPETPSLSWDVSTAQDGSVIATLDETTKTLTISGSGDMAKYDFTALPPYSDYIGSIETVVIEDGVTSIGGYAFYNCSNLTSVEIGNSVTRIESNAFQACSSLASIKIPDGVTSIGHSVFQDCSNLTSVEIGNSVTSIGNSAFKFCSALTSIEIPDSVTSIGNYVFQDCWSIETFTWNAYPASFGEKTPFKNMGQYLSKRTAYIDTRNTDLMTTLEGLGYTVIDSPKDLEPETPPSVDLDASAQHGIDSDGNGTSEVIVTTEAIQMTVTVPVYLPVSVDAAGNVTTAANAKIVNKSYAPVQVQTYNIEAQSPWTMVNDAHDFSKDKVGTKNFNLTVSDDIYNSIDGKSEQPFSYNGKISGQKDALNNALIANIIWLIDWTNGGEPTDPEPVEYTDFTITARNNNMVGYTSTDNENLVIPATFVGEDGVNYKVVMIDECAFQGCKRLTSVVLPNSIKSIAMSAFEGCSQLTSINIPNSVKSIGGYAFALCPSLTSITYNGTTYSSVNDFKTAFNSIEGNNMD